MPDVRCAKCKGCFWWYDDSKQYCRSCANKIGFGIPYDNVKCKEVTYE